MTDKVMPVVEKIWAELTEECEHPVEILKVIERLLAIFASKMGNLDEALYVAKSANRHVEDIIKQVMDDDEGRAGGSH